MRDIVDNIVHIYTYVHTHTIHIYNIYMYVHDYV